MPIYTIPGRQKPILVQGDQMDQFWEKHPDAKLQAEAGGQKYSVSKDEFGYFKEDFPDYKSEIVNTYYTGNNTQTKTTPVTTEAEQASSEDKPGFLGSMANRFAAGATEAFGSAANLVNKIAGAHYDAVNYSKGKETNSYQDNPLAQVGKEAKETAEEYRQAGDYYNGKGFTELFKEGHPLDAAGSAFLSATESLPQSLAIAMGGKLGLLAAFGTTASDKYDQLKEEYPEMPEWKAMSNALWTGASEALTEVFGAGTIGRTVKGLLAKGGKKEAADLVKKSFLNKLAKAEENHWLIMPALSEFSEESANALSEWAVDKMTGVQRDDNILLTMIDAGTAGAMGGVQFSPVIGAAKFQNNRIKNKVTKEFKQASDQVSGFLPDDQKAILIDGLHQYQVNNDLDNAQKFVDEFAQNIGASQEQYKMIVDLARASVGYNNYVDYVNDQIDQETKKRIDEINSLRNPEMGSIVQAKMGEMDDPVYIVGGTLAYKDDMSIDVDNSSDIIYFVDANGKTQQATPQSFSSLVNDFPLEQAYNEAYNLAKTDVIQREEAGDASQFAPGQQVMTSNGVAGQVQSIDEEGNVIVNSNGITNVYKPEDLQIMQEQAQPTMQPDVQQEQAPAFPMDKDGNIDFAQISDPQQFADGLKQEFGDGGTAIIDQYIANEQAKLAKTGKAGDPIKAARDKASAQAKLDFYNQVKGAMGTEMGLTGDQNPINPIQQSDAYQSVEEFNANNGISDNPINPINQTENPIEQEAVPGDTQSVDNGIQSTPENPINTTEQEPAKQPTTDDVVADILDGELDDREVDDYVYENKRAAQNALTVINNKKPKISTNKAEYLAKRAAWQQEADAAQAEVDRWNEIGAKIAETRKGIGADEAARILSVTEPMNGHELAAKMLADGSIKLTHDSFKRETGGGTGEARGFFGLFARPEKGGVNIERAGEMLMLADLEAGTNFFDQNDPNAGRNAIIDVLSEARTRGDLINYIRNNREEQARREQEAQYNAYAQQIMDEYHMTPDEYEAYERLSEEAAKMMTPEQQAEIDGVIYDQIMQEQADEAERMAIFDSLNNNNENGTTETEGGPGTTGGVQEESNGGNEVLPGQQISDPGRGEVLDKQGNEPVSNNAGQDGGAPKSEAERIKEAEEEVNQNPTDAQKEAESKAPESNTKVEQPVQKKWSEMTMDERMKEAEANPLTKEQVEAYTGDDVIKANALAYINGKDDLINSIAYLKVYEDVRNSNGSHIQDNGTKDGTQLAQADNAVNQTGGLGTRGTGGESAEQMDRGSRTADVSGKRSDVQNGEGRTDTNAGAQGDSAIPVEGKPVVGSDTGSNGREGSGTDSTNGRDGKRRGSKTGGTASANTRSRADVPQRKGSKGNDQPKAGRKSVKDIEAERKNALDEFNSILDQFVKAGKKDLSLSLAGLNNEQFEILPKLISAGAKVGYTYIQEGIYKLAEWFPKMKSALRTPLQKVGFSEDEVDSFIKEMWKCNMPIDGVTHTLEEWAAILGEENLRKEVGKTINEKEQLQDQAESIEVKVGDRQNIEETLPYLLPQQRDDVMKAEVQFFDASHNDRDHGNGKGFMFTNGTGTGKTYTGLGIVKRFIKQGKGRVLIVTPSQTKVNDWIKDAANLNIDLRDLDSIAKEKGTTATAEAGDGAVITTFANFRTNKALLESTFDLVVYDESHRILENKSGAGTTGSNQHYMITNRNERYAYDRLWEINPLKKQIEDKFQEFLDEAERIKNNNPSGSDMVGLTLGRLDNNDRASYPKLADIERQYYDLITKKETVVDPQLREQAKQEVPKTKVVFLSATPFNTRENLEYAEGYIFSYPEEDKVTAGSYRHKSPRTEFYLQHFGAGYRFRYGHIEAHTKNAEALAKQEVDFSDYLQNELQTMSGRVIDSEYDYSRDFPTVTLGVAERFNEAVQEIKDSDCSHAMYQLLGDYNYSSALFETLKVSCAIPRIKEHLAKGRKVVVFHRRVESKNPIVPLFTAYFESEEAMLKNSLKEKPNDVELKAALNQLSQLKDKYKDLLDWESTLDMSMPRAQLANEFGADNVLFFSGKESTKVKNQAVDTFNDDNSGKNIIVIQEASGKEGISLHDRTGEHQRALITLALPQSPITALQIEGRIYRIGNKSNAIFEYPLLGLDAEMILFGQRFNNQVGTTENLALGSKARNLRDSFARGVEERSGYIDPETQGFGGKDFDAPFQAEGSEYDRSVLDYYTNQKISGRRDNREGLDYYPTPEPLGFKMVEWSDIREGDSALEPSAGHGAIARYVPRGNSLTAVEPSSSLFAKLQIKVGGSGRKFVNSIFEQYNEVNKHDVVIMNPPFGKAGFTAVQHILKAFKHLDEGGRLVAIVPKARTANNLEDHMAHFHKDSLFRGEIILPDVVFENAGTKVRCRVVIFDKVGNAKLRQKVSPFKYDMSGKYDKVEDFFEELRDVRVPERIIDRNAILKKRAKSVEADIKENKYIEEYEISDKGIYVSPKRLPFINIYWDGLSEAAWESKLLEHFNRFNEWSNEKDVRQAEVGSLMKQVVAKLAGKTEDQMERDVNNVRIEAANKQAGSPSVQTEQPAAPQNDQAAYVYEKKQHTKTGDDMHMAMPKKAGSLSDDEYSRISKIAKNNGGYWNRFMKGFAFKTKEDADRFIAETTSNENDILYREGDNVSNNDPSVEDIISRAKYEPDIRYRMDNDIESVNERFNEELSTLTDENKDSKVLNLGYPSDILLSAGIVDKQMKLYGNKVIKKMKKHGFSLSEIRDLPRAVSDPIAVFNNIGREGNRSILTELKTEQGNFLVTVDLGKDADIDFNVVSSVFGKGSSNVIGWINKGLATYINKEKALSFLSHQSAPIAAAAANEELDSATKIVKDFVNPTLYDGNTEAGQSFAESLGVADQVEFVTDKAELKGKRASAKGFFDRKTGKVTIVVPNHTSVGDMQATILHELVGHYGLRKLFGDKFDDMMDRTFKAMPKELRRAIAEEAISKYRGDIRTATEEYLASIAELGVRDMKLWEKIKSGIKDFFRSIGINLTMRDEDIAYMLWRSKNRLKSSDTMLEVAQKIADNADMQSLLYRDGMGFGSMLNTPKVDRNGVVEISEWLKERLKNRSAQRELYLKVREGYQDNMIRVREWQREVERETGHKVQDHEDFYTFKNQTSSRAQYDMQKFQAECGQAIWDEIDKLAQKIGKPAGEGTRMIENYEMVKHGLERNEYMRQQAIDQLQYQATIDIDNAKAKLKGKQLQDAIDKITAKLNNEVAKYENKDYSGLTALSNEILGSDKMDEAALSKWVDDFEKQYNTMPLWKAIREATNRTLQQQLRTGLISKETYDKISGMYKFYIPLKDWDGTRAQDLYEYENGDRDIIQNPLKHAKGRTTRAGNVLANIASAYESATILGYKNLANQRLLNFVRNSGTQSAVASDQWFIKSYDAQGNEYWQPAYASGFNEDPDHNAKVIADFEADMKQKQEQGLAKTVHEVAKLGVPVKAWQEQQHIVKVKEGGVDKTVYFLGDPRVSQAVNGLNNRNYDMWLIRQANNVRKFMMLNYTSRNVTFILRNLLRDISYVPTMSYVKYGWDFTQKYVKWLPKAMKQLAMAEYGGKADAEVENFYKNGGATGYLDSIGYERYKKEIDSLIKASEGKDRLKYLKKIFAAVGMHVERVNNIVENANRYAVYRAAKESGFSELKAIEAAKEASVNFNRRGSGQYGGAIAQNAYFFFNAAIQGTQNFGSAVANNKVRALKALGFWFALGVMFRSLSGLFGDDDDEYNQLPDYVRQNNLVIPLWKGQYLSIPLSIEIRAVYGLGDMIAQAFQGGYDDNKMGFVSDALLKLMDLAPISIEIPQGRRTSEEIAQSIMKNFVPDAAKPVYDVIFTNENFYGKRITGRNEYNIYIPEWQKASFGTSKALIEASKKLNEATGGDYATKGWADGLLTNPAVAEYLFEQYLGGVGKAFGQAYKTVEAAATGDKVYSRNIPIVSGLTYSTENMVPKDNTSKRYSNYIDDFNEAQSRYKQYQKGVANGEATSEQFTNFVNSPEFMRYQIIGAYKKQVDGINDMRKALDPDDPMNETLAKYALETKRQMIERLKEMEE